MNLTMEVTSRGGLAATHELLKAGATSYRLTRAVATGELVRVRQGWYGLPGAAQLPTEAVRVGGRLTCLSGAHALGLWVHRTGQIHIRVGRHEARLRTRQDRHRRLAARPDASVIVHWGDKRALGTRFALVAGECLWDMAFCASPERVVAAADSALRAGLLSPAQWRRIIRSLPARLGRLLESTDARSESIIESITRFRLQQLGFRPELQVETAGVGHVDLLLGRRLVIELDGWQFHSSRAQFEEDRRRDARLATLGYRVLRFTYRQVMRQWHQVLAAIKAALG